MGTIAFVRVILRVGASPNNAARRRVVVQFALLSPFAPRKDALSRSERRQTVPLPSGVNLLTCSLFALRCRYLSDYAPRNLTMSRILMAALLAILAIATPRAFAQTAVLVVKSATIAPTKANGAAWDFPLVGKKALPDPFVKLWVYDPDGAQADYGETAVDWDTLTPIWNKDIAQVKAGQSLKIGEWDKDLKYDDLIGRGTYKLTEATVEKGSFNLRFDQVRFLKFAVRKSAQTRSETRVTLMQPYPGPNSANRLERSKDRTRAVILVHGLDLRDDGGSVSTPRFADWQGSTSPLVKSLSRHADVFSIAYAQNTAVEEIASFPELREAVGNVKQLGYRSEEHTSEL